MQALRDCAADMKQAPKRYCRAGRAARAAFPGRGFRYDLVGHFLFMYADRWIMIFTCDHSRVDAGDTRRDSHFPAGGLVEPQV